MPYSILVVEDEEFIRNICEDSIPLWGYDVETVSDGSKAMEKLKYYHYDIILTDLCMPGIDGITLLEKAKNYAPQTEVIIMTGYGTVDDAVSAMKKGAFDFLLKPLSLVQMEIVLQKCINSIELKQENRDLSEVNLKLRELNEKKEKFISITSHELRTPVSTINSFVDMIKDLLCDNEDEELKEYLTIVEDVVKEMIQVIDEMYNMALLDTGNLKLKKSKFNIVKVISSVVTELSPLVKNRKQTIKWNSNLGKVYYIGDRFRISQALKEIIQNAVKFSPDGGIIDVSLLVENIEKLKISVKDNGIGISEDKLSAIFEKFYEVQDSDFHSTSKTDFMGAGLGLGLSIAEEIVFAHGGTIKVESEPGKGSVFTIELPLEG